MTTVSNIGIGAHLAGNAAAKARHGMNEAIARLSTGNRAMYGGDAAGHGAGLQFRAEGKSAYVAARGAEDGISFLQAAESALFEIAALNTRLRELEVQSKSALLGTGEAAAIAAEETRALAAEGVLTAALAAEVASTDVDLAALQADVDQNEADAHAALSRLARRLASPAIATSSFAPSSFSDILVANSLNYLKIKFSIV